MSQQPQAVQFTCGVARQGPWQLASVGVVGSRHVLEGKPCEDTLAHRFPHQGGVHVAVCDGVSGGALGDVASFAAARHCVDWGWHNETGGVDASAKDSVLYGTFNVALHEHVQQLDEVVRQALTVHTRRAGATTLAAAWLHDDGRGWLSQVGDVRAYLWSSAGASTLASAKATLALAGRSNTGLLAPVSRDQTYSLLGELPPVGVPAGNPARMCGNGSAGQTLLLPLALEPGQALLLCSDGLHGFMSDREIAEVLSQSSAQARGRAELAQTTRRLLRRAVRNGGDDDIAVMLLCKTA